MISKSKSNYWHFVPEEVQLVKSVHDQKMTHFVQLRESDSVLQILEGMSNADKEARVRSKSKIRLTHMKTLLSEVLNRYLDCIFEDLNLEKPAQALLKRRQHPSLNEFFQMDLLTPESRTFTTFGQQLELFFNIDTLIANTNFDQQLLLEPPIFDPSLISGPSTVKQANFLDKIRSVRHI